MRYFNIGAKYDPNTFQMLSNERHWSDYKNHNIATANSENIEEVLDLTCIPINGFTNDLFITYSNLNKTKYSNR